MFPKLPENLAALTAADLRSLAAEIRVAAQAVVKDAASTPEQLAEALEYAEKRTEILNLAKLKDAAAGIADTMSEDDEAEPVAEATAEPEDLTEAEAEEQADEADASEEDADAEGADDDQTADDGDDNEVEASVVPKVRTTTGVTSVQEKVPAALGDITPDRLLARSGVMGKTAGESFSGWGDVAQALIDKHGQIRRNSTETFEVAYIPGNFSEADVLGDNYLDNLRLFDLQSDPEIMAELCAPLTPQYDLSCWNTDRRPVRNSMRGFQAPRGGVTIYPSPTLSDLVAGVNGVGVWTTEDDASQRTEDPSEKACAVIECADPDEFRIYGVWRCLTVQNLMAMTFPELVEAYLNRLAAWHARTAEVQLLEAMATRSEAVDASPLGYGTTTSITSTILNLLALHQEQERWDNGDMVAYLPRWIRYAMKMDMMRRRNSSGAAQSVPSDAQIDALFREVGVDPYFFIDTPSWATPVPAVKTGGTLNLLPNSVEMIIAPRGKFAVMDRGELSIGVTGNNIYRDNASNAKNQFTFFFENFEGLVDTNSCPAYLLTVDGLCHNGIQIDDAVIACDGAGAGS